MPRNAWKMGWRLSASAATYWLTISLLVGVPLAFSTAVYSIYSTPKFALLLTGTAALAPMLIWTIARTSPRSSHAELLTGSTQVLLVSLYLIVISISTVFGVSPVTELFGSSYNRMGLITRLCFFVLFLSLIVSVGRSEKRLRTALWAMTLTGLVVSTYAYAQFFGRDPFLLRHLYTFESESGTVVRVNSTLGNSNYLGNFLLYVTPLGAGLALASRGHARRIALAAAALSTVAVIFTGTRGAWLGLAVAILVFAAIATSGRLRNLLGESRSMPRRSVVVFVAILIFAVLIGLNPASRNIVLRSRSLVEDGFTGAGRTTLWRDSMKMVTQYPLMGCGPEGFREAFLPHKSLELARLAPGSNNESSHNSYIDSAVSFGLPGVLLYVAILASSFALLIGALRRSTDKGERTIRTALISSLAGVAVHNFFIFDQISTGLYFFAFAALAQIASNTGAGNLANQDSQGSGSARLRGGARLEPLETSSDSTKRAKKSPRPVQSPAILHRSSLILVTAGFGLLAAAIWYAIGIARADLYLSKAIVSANAGDLDGVIEQGNRAVESPDPTGDYNFLFARTLALCADNLAESEGEGQREYPESRSPTPINSQAINLAMFHAEKSLAHTLTPDSNYLLLAYLALQLGDTDKLFAYATEAVTRDPNFSTSHWLMAEAYLARAERPEAASEARLALKLDPHSSEARRAFKRATGVPRAAKSEDLLRYATTLASDGKTERAVRVLRRAVRRGNGYCPDCHSSLASIYEKANLYPEAITEWEAFAREAPQRALVEKTALRLEKLRQQVGLAQ